MSQSSEQALAGQETAMKAARSALEGLRVIVAHGNRESLKELTTVVEKRHSVMCECTTVGEVLGTASKRHPDMIVTGVDFPDGDGIDAVIQIGVDNPVPAVIVAERRSLELVEKAMRDHVMAYLIEPIDPVDLEAAIVVAQSRFEQFRELVDQVDSLKQALEDRKTIERAKGAIMAEKQLGEAEAFAILRSRAQNARVKMIEIARGVLESGADYEPKANA
jgi:response regulator NasT